MSCIQPDRRFPTAMPATCRSRPGSLAVNRCRARRAIGYSGATAASSRSGMRTSAVRPAPCALNKPVNGMERTCGQQGLLARCDDGGIFTFGDAKFHGSMGGKPSEPAGHRHGANEQWERLLAVRVRRRHLQLRRCAVRRFAREQSAVVAGRRDATHAGGRGYWMLTADGRVFKFGDAADYGDIAGCGIYGSATRMLVTPNGKGYWIGTEHRRDDRVRRREEVPVPADRRWRRRRPDGRQRQLTLPDASLNPRQAG